MNISLNSIQENQKLWEISEFSIVPFLVCRCCEEVNCKKQKPRNKHDLTKYEDKLRGT